MKLFGKARIVVSLTALLFAMIGHARAQETARETTGAIPQEVSTSLIQDNAADHAGVSPSSPDLILVINRPVEVLASPSSSASPLYGFPAGRSVRLIGRDGGFARIQDLNSSATGWIDNTALVPPSPVDAAVAIPSMRKPAHRNQKAVTASSEEDTGAVKPAPGSVQKSKPIGNSDLRPNGRQRPLSGFLAGLFGR